MNNKVQIPDTIKIPLEPNQKETKAIRDLVAIAIISILAFILADVFKAFDLLIALSQKYGETQVDKLIVVLMMLGIAFGIFVARRWKDLAEEIALHKQTADKLRRNEATLHALMNATYDSMLLLDSNGTVLTLNASSAKRLGKSADEIIGKCVFDLLPAEVAGKRKQYVETVIRTGTAVRFEDERNHMVFDNQLYPILDIEGKTEQVAIFGREITEQKRVEKLNQQLIRLGKELSAVTKPEEIARLILTSAADLIGWDAAAINIFSPELRPIFPGIAFDTIQGKRQECSADLQGILTPLCKRVLEQGPLLISDNKGGNIPESDSIAFGDKTKRSESLMYIPLRKGQENIGILTIQSYTPNAYTSRDLERLQLLADYCNTAIERSYTEVKLREQGEKVRSLLNAPMHTMLLMDTYGIIIVVNEAFAKIHGVTKEELIGKCLYDLYPLEWMHPRRERIEQVIHTKQPLVFEDEREGRYLEISVYPILNAQSTVDKIAIFAQNITDRKKMMEAIQESEERYRQLIEFSPYPMMLHSDGKMIYVNTATQTALRATSSDQLIGKSVFDFIHPDYIEAAKERIRMMVEEGKKPPLVELKLIRVDGVVIDAEIASIPFDYQGRPAVLVVGRDISARKRAEHILRESETRYRRAIALANAVPFELDRNSLIYTYMDNGIKELTGYSREEITLDRWMSLIQKVELRGELVELPLEEAVRRSNSGEITAWLSEVQIKTQTGETKWIAETNVTELDSLGKPFRTLGILQDITARKLAEERTKQYQEELRALSTKLTLTEERERHQIAQSLHDHIGQMLALCKIKLGELPKVQEISKPVTEIRNLLEQAIQYVRTLTVELSPPILYEVGFESAIEWLAEQIQTQYNVSVRVKSNMVAQLIDSELRVLLYQMIRELLVNIGKHAHTRNASVTLHREGNILHIKVEDTGVGFALFPFETNFSKTGKYGLFHIQEQSKSIGATMQVDSAPGKGTTVSISVPMKQI
jgi:PAS domain S-box-containing protein